MPTAYLPEQLLILLMPLKAYPAKIDILSRNAAPDQRARFLARLRQGAGYAINLFTFLVYRHQPNLYGQTD